MTTEQKTWIDNATYEQLLHKNRFAPIGDPIMMDEAGAYFMAALRKKRAEVGDAAHVRASKSIGWEG